MKMDSPGSGVRRGGGVTISGGASGVREDDEAERARSGVVRGAGGAIFFCRANGTAAGLSALPGFDVFLLFFARAACSSAATRFDGATFFSTAAGGLAGFRGF
jgi:hypothetical protein